MPVPFVRRLVVLRPPLVDRLVAVGTPPRPRDAIGQSVEGGGLAVPGLPAEEAGEEAAHALPLYPEARGITAP